MITKVDLHKNKRGENDSFVAVINGITCHVPLDPKNKDYQEIMKLDTNVFTAVKEVETKK